MELGTVGVGLVKGNMGCFGSFCIGLGFGNLHVGFWEMGFGIWD